MKRFFKVEQFKGNACTSSSYKPIILSYYRRKFPLSDSSHQRLIRGWIFVHEITRIYASLHTQSTSNQNCVVVEHPSKTWVLFALTYEEHLEWYHGLTKLWHAHKIEENIFQPTKECGENMSRPTYLISPPMNDNCLSSRDNEHPDLDINDSCNESCSQSKPQQLSSNWHESLKELVEAFDQVDTNDYAREDKLYDKRLRSENSPSKECNLIKVGKFKERTSQLGIARNHSKAYERRAENFRFMYEDEEETTYQPFIRKKIKHAAWVLENWDDNGDRSVQDSNSMSSLSDWDNPNKSF